MGNFVAPRGRKKRWAGLGWAGLGQRQRAAQVQHAATTTTVCSARVPQEYNDTLLALYLAAMTRGTHLANEVVDKFSMAYEKAGRGRRGGGMMMP